MATPVVQIVHYSDLHIVGPQYMAQRRSFEALVKRLPGVLKQGVAGASLAAFLMGRGRDAGRPAPPARIRTSGFPAYGSYLGWMASKRTRGYG